MVHLAQLRGHLERLAYERDPFLNSSHYFFARAYISEEMKKYGAVEIQRSPSPYGELENIILHLPASDPNQRPIIIGAHYDTVPGSPGADDNASGVAVLLTLAQAFSQTTFQIPIRLIAFDLEEYGLLGSQAYVKRLQENNETVRFMVSLEMLGYINHEPNSQRYPQGLSAFYPNCGNFIALIGNLQLIPVMHQLCRALQSADASCEWLPVPFNGKLLPVTRRSDHAPFWDYGSPAMMMTDTADLRNPNYHRISDTLETLDLNFMDNLVTGLIAGITAIAA